MSIVLMKKHIIEQLQGFQTQFEKIRYLKYMKQSMIDRKESIMNERSKTFYENRLLWLDEQINIIEHTIDSNDNSNKFM